MTFQLDPEAAAVLAALAEESGPPPAPPPVGDVDGRRVALNAMLEQANSVAQSIAADVSPPVVVAIVDRRLRRARRHR